MITEAEILLRILVAALLGFAVGFERERQDHSAGLRTHMILVIGAALVMPLSINLAVQYADLIPGGDPARLAAQVVSGIGFLGAGVIFRYGSNVRGLTTAASLWTMAMVGLAVGAGLYGSGVFTTILLLFILTVMNYLEDRVITTYNRMHVTLWAEDRPGVVEDVRGLFLQKKRRMKVLDFEKDLTEGLVILDVHVRLLSTDHFEQLVDDLGRLEGVKRVKIRE